MTERDNTRKNILIIDPDRDTGELFARALETYRDCKCYLASGESEVMSLLKDISFTLVLVDLGMLMAGDFSLLKRIKRSFPQVLIVVDAYLHQKSLLAEAIALGADGTIIKPIKVDLFRQEMDAFCRLKMSPVS